MRSFDLVSLLSGLAFALPQDGCATSTAQVIVPTTTATYTTNPVVTVHPTTAKDLGTFTEVTTISSTKTLQTITTTVASCSTIDVVSMPWATETVYRFPSATPGPKERHLGFFPLDCTVTVTSTTTYGQTQVWITGSKTSIYYDYTAFSQDTVTSTETSGTAYAIATGAATSMMACGKSTVTHKTMTSTVTLDARCSPSAMVSAYYNHGIEWLSDTPAGGATYETNATDSSACCQLCARADSCAASAWDIRTSQCRLQFPVSPETGGLDCGEGLLAYYDAGPNHPMSPGAGWYIAQICGNIEFGASQPDDGS